MKEPYGKGDRESILASSLAGNIARYRLKRRQRHWWAGFIELRKADETGRRLHSNKDRDHADREEDAPGNFGGQHVLQSDQRQIRSQIRVWAHWVESKLLK